MSVEFSHGSINRRVWKYCTEHNRMVTKGGSASSCAASSCAGKKRERFEYCFVYTGKDGTARRARGHAATRDEALSSMQARKDELLKVAEAPVPPAKTLNAFADEWIETIKAGVEPRTVESYAGMLKRHIRPTLGALPLPSVTRGMVKDLLAAKRTSGLSKDSVRLIRATLSALFSDAMDHELVTANPASKVGRGRGRKAPDSVTASERRQRVKAMSTTQLNAFLVAAARDRLADLWLFLVDTGVRPGEAFALRWDDVDLVARTAHVHASIERGSRRVKATKTGTDRYVDLTPRLVKVLDALQLAVEQRALESGREAPDLVFPSDAGTILDGWNVAKRFRSIVTRSGLEKFSIYDTRHTYASHALLMGAPITYVAKQLGHSKPTMTLQAYAHWIPATDHGLADRLEAWRTRAGELVAGK